MKGKLWGSMFVGIAVLNLLVFFMTLAGYKPSELSIKANYLIVSLSFLTMALNIFNREVK